LHSASMIDWEEESFSSTPSMAIKIASGRKQLQQPGCPSRFASARLCLRVFFFHGIFSDSGAESELEPWRNTN
jgi:hypothetical protein